MADLVNADPEGVVLGPDRAVLLMSLADSSAGRVGLGYEHKQIRDILLTELRATSREMLMIYGNMSRFLLLEANITERIRQGVLPGDFDEMGDLYREIESHWDYSDYCIHFGAICDIDRGTNYLPTIVQRFET